MSVEETRTRLLTVGEKIEDLLALVHDLNVQEMSSEENFLIEALSELHNTGTINFVKAVRGIDRNSSRYDFFVILLVFEKVLHSLDARVDDILECLVNLTQQANGDLAIGGIYGAFEHFCRVKAHRPRESVAFILSRSEISAYTPFLSNSILAYRPEDFVEAIQTIGCLADHKNEEVRNRAYFTLGRLSLNENQASLIWGMLNSSASRERDDNCCASILIAVLQFGERFPSYWPSIEEFIITFVDRASPEVLYAISRVSAFQGDSLPENVLYILAKKMANVSSEHKAIVDNIDHFLVALVKKDFSYIAIELLESILTAGVAINSLDYFSSQLSSKYQELRNHIITKWFLSGEIPLCHSVLDLLTNSVGSDVEIKADIKLLDNDLKSVFVVRKAVGWLYTQPVATVSFILSISDVVSKDAFRNIEDVLYDPMLLSYPGELKKFFQSCIDRNVQENLCKYLLDKLSVYHDDLEKISKLKELKAPHENVNAYWKDFSKDMQDAHDEASKHSFIRKIVTVQRLLYGNSSIYYVHQSDGGLIRQEMQMHSFSHSTEMPSLNVLDPESLDYNLRVYRCERIANETNS